jgi:glycine/D-amino acid oxidase-like deaminating enzyme
MTTAVIGAGIIGTASALALARTGESVLLIDRDEPGMGCSFGNAGHIATEQRVPLASAQTIRRLPAMLLDREGPLAVRPGVMPQLLMEWGWRFLLAALPSAYARNAAALAALVDGALADLRQLLAGTPAQMRLQERGNHLVWEGKQPPLPDDAPFELWRDGGWPELPQAIRARIKGGLTYTGTGHVTSPRGVVLGLRDALLGQGGRELRSRVTRLIPNAGGWEIRHDGGALQVERVLVATGVDAGALLRPLGYTVPLVAERGYHVALLGQGGLIDRPIVFHERSVIVTPMEGELRATTTTEFSPRFAPPTPRRWALLRMHMREMGLPEGERREWMGNRPTLPDYMPAIGISRRHPGLMYAFGHQHLGMTLSGATARLVREMATGSGEPPPEFSLERFM